MCDKMKYTHLEYETAQVQLHKIREWKTEYLIQNNFKHEYK